MLYKSVQHLLKAQQMSATFIIIVVVIIVGGHQEWKHPKCSSAVDWLGKL